MTGSFEEHSGFSAQSLLQLINTILCLLCTCDAQLHSGYVSQFVDFCVHGMLCPFSCGRGRLWTTGRFPYCKHQLRCSAFDYCQVLSSTKCAQLTAVWFLLWEGGLCFAAQQFFPLHATESQNKKMFLSSISVFDYWVTLYLTHWIAPWLWYT